MGFYYYDWRKPEQRWDNHPAHDPNDQRTAPFENPSCGSVREVERTEIPECSVLSVEKQLLAEQRETKEMLNSILEVLKSIANNQVMFAGR